jgi:hypothetical protein
MGWGYVDDINDWWKRTPGERYWLDVTDRDEREALLAAPKGDGKAADSWTHRLITHVRDGDVVFHYNPSQQGITRWSVASGRVRKQDLLWPYATGENGNGSGSQRLPSWGIELRQPVRLRAGVPLAEIARVQWKLFPALRALEDRSGGPLYYPFEMGMGDITRPLSGYVFKLPAVFVQGFAGFAGALAQVEPQHTVPGRTALPMAAPASSELATSR